MKAIFYLAAVAVLFLAPSPCFALWEIATVTKERATELGMEIRAKAAGPNAVRVELEFKVEGELKHFSEIELLLGQEDNLKLFALLREDQSKPGRVAVNFTADRAQLDKLSLRVRVPFRDGGAGGTIYNLRVKEFVEVEPGR